MRTRTLLLAAAALSSGMLAASAQVYSANVVGYVNVVFPPGNTLWANPLTNTTGNSLSQLFPKGTDGMTVSRWSNASSTWLPGAATFYSDNGGYDTGVWDDAGITLITPGEGLLLYNPGQSFTNTFVGDVIQGAVSTTIPTGASMLGSVFPIAGSVGTVLANFNNLPDGSTVSTFSNGTGAFNPDASTWYAAPDNIWDPAGSLAVGEGFLLINAGGPVSWNRTYTVQ